MNPSKRRYWPSPELCKMVPGKLIMPHQAARMMGISKTELRNRTKSDPPIIESHIDPVSGWTWYSELYICAWLGITPNDSNGKALRARTRRERMALRHKFQAAAGPPPMFRPAVETASSNGGGHGGNGTQNQSPFVAQENSQEDLGIVDAETVTATPPKDVQAIFAALRESKSLANIVIELGAHPDAVRACADVYAAMTETLYISAEDRKTLQEFPYFGVEHALTNGKQLILAIQEMTTKRLTCARCNARNARFCGDEACETPREVEARAAQVRKDNDALLHATADLLRTKPMAAQPFMPKYQPEVAEAMGGAK